MGCRSSRWHACFFSDYSCGWALDAPARLLKRRRAQCIKEELSIPFEFRLADTGYREHVIEGRRTQREQLAKCAVVENHIRWYTVFVGQALATGAQAFPDFKIRLNDF